MISPGQQLPKLDRVELRSEIEESVGKALPHSITVRVWVRGLEVDAAVPLVGAGLDEQLAEDVKRD